MMWYVLSGLGAVGTLLVIVHHAFYSETVEKQN